MLFQKFIKPILMACLLVIINAIFVCVTLPKVNKAKVFPLKNQSSIMLPILCPNVQPPDTSRKLFAGE